MLSLAVKSENATVTNGSTWNFIWDNFGYDFVTVVYYISLTVLVFCLIVLFLRMCGFGTIGIVKGSQAAFYQSGHAIVAGSCFSCMQSLAMRLGRILIISAIISGLLLYGCIKLKDMFPISPPQNSTMTTPAYNWTQNSTVEGLGTASSLSDGKQSTVDIVLLFGNSTSLNVPALATPIALVSSNNTSSNENATSSSEDVTISYHDSMESIAARLKGNFLPQFWLLLLVVLHLRE